jgi:hypothetical protein
MHKSFNRKLVYSRNAQQSCICSVAASFCHLVLKHLLVPELVIAIAIDKQVVEARDHKLSARRPLISVGFQFDLILVLVGYNRTVIYPDALLTYHTLLLGPAYGHPKMPIPIPTTSAPTGSTSQWHCISPSTRPLNLQVLEITSISLTIALSLARQPSSRSTLQASSSTSNSAGASGSAAKQRRPRHRTKGTHHESDEDLTAVEEDNDGPGADSVTLAQNSDVPPPYVSSSQSGPFPARLAPLPQAKPSFKELLSKGVMVTVNGRPWNQIVAHVSDDEPAGSVLDSSSVTAENEALNSRLVDKMVGQMTRDRAVVGIFGLEPGKEYEIDLKVVANFAGDGEPLQAG